MRPRIGITKPSSRGWTQNIALRIAVLMAGGTSINLTPQNPRFESHLDGLIISGGTDIYPGLFQNLDIKENYPYDHDRDQLELDWIGKARRDSLPIFGICRGAQLLNVALGGTLVTDVRKAFEGVNYPTHLLGQIFFRKPIFIVKDSLLYQAFQTEKTKVNSLHSQSIDKLGQGLLITSKEASGIVQSIEHRAGRFILGVQFHPEFLIYRRSINRLFRNFVSNCTF